MTSIGEKKICGRKYGLFMQSKCLGRISPFYGEWIDRTED